jgi:gamma-glutamyltranspeptidase/glutathione hydrolase
MIARALPAVLLALALPLAGCKQAQRFFFGGPPPGTPGYVIGFLGAVIADEPRAALEAREVLSEGGNAADAATTIALTLAVTLPSRAGLGGGGACLAYFPPAKTPEAIMFLPQPADSAQTDRPAAVPMLLRGLLTLQARHGTRTIANLIQPAEGLARFGVPVSTALARDLKVVGQALTLDPGAARAFASISGGPLTEGTTLMQPDLGTTFAEIRINGVNDLYGGALAERLERAAANAGSPITATDLAKARASIAEPIIIPGWPGDHNGAHEDIAFLPLPADGGLAAAAAFQALTHNAENVSGAKAIALAVAARYRQSGGDAKTLLSTPPTLATEPGSATLPALPASTGFVALDRKGGAVACDVTMGNLFGIGRIARGTGLVLAASPKAWPPPLLSAAIAFTPARFGFRAAVAASGQEGAPLAAAAALAEALSMPAKPKLKKGETPRFVPTPVPEPGRANIAACSAGLPGPEKFCAWQADPRLSGLATGGQDQEKIEMEREK